MGEGDRFSWFLHSFLNPHQSPSCFCGIFRTVPTGRDQHLQYVTILSATHYFSHSTNHQLKLLFVCLFVCLSVSQRSLEQPLHEGRNLACSQLSPQHWAQYRAEMFNKYKTRAGVRTQPWFWHRASCSKSGAFPTQAPGSLPWAKTIHRRKRFILTRLATKIQGPYSKQWLNHLLDN